MNTFLYVILAIIGTIFGSFFTLAVYRIPRKENIIYIRSHCTKCNHRLEFWDLIPIFSYIFLGGKCRYCKEPIRPRYLLLELLSGLIFVLIALAMNITVTSTFIEFITYAYSVLIVSVFCIILGIGKNINISVVLFGMLIQTLYFIFINTVDFRQFFFETSIFIIISLAIYIYFIIKNKEKDFQRDYPHAIGIILIIGLLIYIFGINLTTIIMALSIIVGLISRYVFKRNTDYIMYIALISIISLIFISNDITYQYIYNTLLLK